MKMKSDFSQFDIQMMRQALSLAQKGQGRVEPNPMVGAIVTKNEKIIGRGYHRCYGQAHAERNAIAQVRNPRNLRGGTLYVTLEPCCHHGKQPPCTDAILEAGIARVVCAVKDPFEKVAGKGIALLRKKGVQVQVGCLEEHARRLNAAFIKRITTGKPYVIAKWAQTLDGAIATKTGESKWISSETSRAFVQTLRGRMDAVIVGITTALADDPYLLARPENARDLHRIATRIVLDSRCRLPLTSSLVRTLAYVPVMVVHTTALDNAAEKRRRKLQDAGVITLPINPDKTGRLNLSSLFKWLGKHEYANILVEGGGELLASLLRSDQADELHIFIAPKIIGGKNARRAIAGPDLPHLKDAIPLHFTTLTTSGPDLHLIATRNG